MLSQPFSLARNCCPKEEREEDFYNEKSPYRLTFSIIRAINEYGLNTVCFNYPELSDRYISNK